MNRAARQIRTNKLARILWNVILALIAVAVARPAPCQNLGPASTRTVRIGVLGLFRPQAYTLNPASNLAIVIRAGDQTIALERSSGVDSAKIRLAATEHGGEIVTVEAGSYRLQAPRLTVANRFDGPADFELRIPGKITRPYLGRLEIKPAGGALLAVVTMDIETAVASVVSAEDPPGTAFEALKAQAVAARSYFAAGAGRHHDSDFCDTTHCQFLREPPSRSGLAAKAAAATQGLLLAYQSRPFAAMYTRSCGGRTRSAAELGLSVAHYPYYSVDCPYCREHPAKWRREIPAAAAVTLRSSNEPARLELTRRLGWNTVPSNDFVIRRESGELILVGSGQGHGLGLCQAGANAMAQSGADFRQILAHYYPNTEIISLK